MTAVPEGSGPQPPVPGSPSVQANARRASEQVRSRSPFMFLVIGLCFFLPFISISCSGQRIATLSGQQLVTGADITVEDPTRELQEAFGTPPDGEAPFDETQENDPNLWAIVALAGAILGIVVGFVAKGRSRSIASLVAALAGLAGLIGLRFDLEGDLEEAEGLVAIDYRVGYWLVLVLFTVLTLAHGSFLRAGRQSPGLATGPPGPGP